MRFLTLNYVDGCYGRTYYFCGFQDWQVRAQTERHYSKEKRVYFIGKDDKDCLEKAYKFCKRMDVSSEKSKLKLLLDDIKKRMRI